MINPLYYFNRTKWKASCFIFLSFYIFLMVGCNVTSEQKYDIVVYGGTSAGVIAAVKASRMGKSVVLIEPGKHLGGLSSGGLGATDIGNKKAIGGMAREFYQHIYSYYNPTSDSAMEMWTFEPHVAEDIFNNMIIEENIPVHFEERLKLLNGVTKSGIIIKEVEMESGLRFQGKMFIAATYEGDLMANS